MFCKHPLRLAAEIGLEAGQFERHLHAPLTDRLLQEEILLARSLGVKSFPSLVLQTGPHTHQLIPVDYDAADSMLKQIHTLIP